MEEDKGASLVGCVFRNLSLCHNLEISGFSFSFRCAFTKWLYYAAQDSLDLTACLNHLNAKIIGVCHCAQQCVVLSFLSDAMLCPKRTLSSELQVWSDK